MSSLVQEEAASSSDYSSDDSFDLELRSDSSDDWEEASVPAGGLSSTVEPPSAPVDIPADGIKILIDKKRKRDEEREKKKKKKVVPGSHRDAASLHQIQLLFALARLRRENKICNDARVHDACFSCLSPDVMQSILQDSKVLKASTLEKIVDYFAKNFNCEINSHPKGFLPVSLDRLIRVCQKKSGTQLELHLILCSLFRAVGKPARLVAAVTPTRVRKKIKDTTRKKSNGSAKGKSLDKHMASELLSPRSSFNRSKNAPTTWVEVYGGAFGEALPPQMDADLLYGAKKKMSSTPKKSKRMIEKSTERAGPSGGGESSASIGAVKGTVRRSDKTIERWIHVDVVRHLIDRPSSVEWLRPKTENLMYVFAIDNAGKLVDVLERYSFRPSAARKQHFPDKYKEYENWLPYVMSSFNRAADVRGQGNGEAYPSGKRASEEQRELSTLRLNEQIPTTKNAFRTHPLYALESLLTQNQVIHGADKAVGYFRGAPVYKREHVTTLHTEKYWKRECREVKEGEYNTPAKFATKSLPQGQGGPQMLSDRLTSDEDDEDEEHAQKRTVEVPLYGFWQTQVYVPPPVTDGKIPRNDFGNWEVWTAGHVPSGALHLNLPKIELTVKKLDIEFVPCVAGFERKKGRTIPVRNGVLILQGMKDAVLAAHDEMEFQREKEYMAKRRRKVIQNWRRFVSTYRVRRYVQDKYKGKKRAAITAPGASAFIREPEEI